MPENKSVVQLKDSISVQILRIVFGLYLIVTLSVTLLHMGAEYSETQSQIIDELAVFQETFGPGMAKSMWDLDQEQLELMARGILASSNTVGLHIQGIQTGSKDITVGQVNLPNADDSTWFNQLFWYEFPLRYHDDYGNVDTVVGQVTLYSHSDVVLQKVKLGFIFIFINALIKTLALWVIFLVVSRLLLSRPLSILTEATEKLHLTNLEDFKMGLQIKQNNELKLMESAFHTMVEKLIVAKNRLVSFRTFTAQIAHFKETTHIFQSAFPILCTNVQVTHAVYMDSERSTPVLNHFSENTSLRGISQVPSEAWFREAQLNFHDDIVSISSVQPGHPLHHFYEKHGLDVTGGHFVYARLPTLKSSFFCLFRQSGSVAFDSSDLEYTRSLVSETQVLQQNLDSIRSNVRMENELNTASAVQRALLPKFLERWKNLELGCYFQSATETAGDWYEFMTQIEDHFYILIGDVAGHGTASALVTATTKGACQILEKMYAHQKLTPRPAELLEQLNKIVFTAGHPLWPMTFFIARINLTNGELVFSNAGHNFPWLLRQSEAPKVLLNTNQRLGSREESVYTEATWQLQNNDRLFFFTDGLIENENPAGDMWGERRLMRLLKRRKWSNAQQMVDDVLQEARSFYDEAPASDDITVVSCRVAGPFSSNH